MRRSRTEAPFPPPALPGPPPATTGLSVTLNGPACPSGAAGWRVPRHRQGFPYCVPSPPSTRAAANTPAERVGACVARFLSRPRRPLSSECLGRYRCLHRPLRLLPAGATVAGLDSHLLRDDAFHRPPPLAAMGAETTHRSIVHYRYPLLGAAARSPVPSRNRLRISPPDPDIEHAGSSSIPAM